MNIRSIDPRIAGILGFALFVISLSLPAYHTLIPNFWGEYPSVGSYTIGFKAAFIDPLLSFFEVGTALGIFYATFFFSNILVFISPFFFVLCRRPPTIFYFLYIWFAVSVWFVPMPYGHGTIKPLVGYWFWAIATTLVGISIFQLDRKHGPGLKQEDGAVRQAPEK